MGEPSLGTGYAMIAAGGPVVSTVSPTERAAMVNALVEVFGVMVTNRWTDDQIAQAWSRYEARGFTIAPVLVTPLPSKAAMQAGVRVCADRDAICPHGMNCREPCTERRA